MLGRLIDAPFEWLLSDCGFVVGGLVVCGILAAQPFALALAALHLLGVV